MLLFSRVCVFLNGDASNKTKFDLLKGVPLYFVWGNLDLDADERNISKSASQRLKHDDDWRNNLITNISRTRLKNDNEHLWTHFLAVLIDISVTLSFRFEAPLTYLNMLDWWRRVGSKVQVFWHHTVSIAPLTWLAVVHGALLWGPYPNSDSYPLVLLCIGPITAFVGLILVYFGFN